MLEGTSVNDFFIPVRPYKKGTVIDLLTAVGVKRQDGSIQHPFITSHTHFFSPSFSSLLTYSRHRILRFPSNRL